LDAERDKEMTNMFVLVRMSKANPGFVEARLGDVSSDCNPDDVFIELTRETYATQYAPGSIVDRFKGMHDIHAVASVNGRLLEEIVSAMVINADIVAVNADKYSKQFSQGLSHSAGGPGPPAAYDLAP